VIVPLVLLLGAASSEKIDVARDLMHEFGGMAFDFLPSLLPLHLLFGYLLHYPFQEIFEVPKDLTILLVLLYQSIFSHI
jgi:hypothetical protein